MTTKEFIESNTSGEFQNSIISYEEELEELLEKYYTYKAAHIKECLNKAGELAIFANKVTKSSINHLSWNISKLELNLDEYNQLILENGISNSIKH